MGKGLAMEAKMEDGHVSRYEHVTLRFILQRDAGTGHWKRD